MMRICERLSLSCPENVAGICSSNGMFKTFERNSLFSMRNWNRNWLFGSAGFFLLLFCFSSGNRDGRCFRITFSMLFSRVW